jgi:hypothetical protein
MPMLDASVSKIKVSSGQGYSSTRADVSALFSLLKASAEDFVQLKGTYFLVS